MEKTDYIIALAGNPNTGKSTIFNSLTGLRQHTGNWPGKTVTNARGSYVYRNKNFTMVDLPGTYSLRANSADEEVARDFVNSGEPDVTLVVMDSTSLERNLILALQILALTNNVIVCANLTDEAERKGIHVDYDGLAQRLGVPVVATNARDNRGIEELRAALYNAAKERKKGDVYPIAASADQRRDKPFCEEAAAVETVKEAERISVEVVTRTAKYSRKAERQVDDILTSGKTGIPVMIALLTVIFWITAVGANKPSELLVLGFGSLGLLLDHLFLAWGAPVWLYGLLLDGVFRTTAWVVAVMLPPMAIFFPLFTIFEDLGYLPRVAFNLDSFFKKACAHGKQSLTMCMGFGCNAAGVIACRIIESPRERLIAVLTNNYVPCNGRLPSLITLASLFALGETGLSRSVFAALCVLGVIILGVVLTLLNSRLLSQTLLKGLPSSFALELPPYRRPQIGRIIVRSLFDRTAFVLLRAVKVAAPAGALIWLLANMGYEGKSLMAHSAQFLDPAGRLLGMDGSILLAFLLGLPANELVIPLLLMSYMSVGVMPDVGSIDSLRAIFIERGWNWLTAATVMIFVLSHFPCATTLLTIKKETNSLKWTAISFLAPLFTGAALCFLLTQTVRLLGWG